MNSHKEAQKLAQKVWGAEYQKLLKQNRLDFVDGYSQADLELIKKHCQLGPQTSFLEIGCGRGRVSAMLAKLGVNVTGLDISPEAIMLAQKIFKKHKLRGRFVVGDIENLPFEDKAFDLIFGGGVIEHIEETPQAFGEAYRVLKRGGKLVTTVPCLSLTSLPQAMLTGSIPQVPILKQWHLFMHRTALKDKFMRYGYEKLYTIGQLKEFAEKAGFRQVKVEPYLPQYDFKFVPTAALKKLAARIVRRRGFWPMIGLVGEK